MCHDKAENDLSSLQAEALAEIRLWITSHSASEIINMARNEIKGFIQNFSRVFFLADLRPDMIDFKFSKTLYNKDQAYGMTYHCGGPAESLQYGIEILIDSGDWFGANHMNVEDPNIDVKFDKKLDDRDSQVNLPVNVEAVPELYSGCRIDGLRRIGTRLRHYSRDIHHLYHIQTDAISRIHRLAMTLLLAIMPRPAAPDLSESSIVELPLLPFTFLTQ